MCITERAAPCHATPRRVPARPGRVRQRLECWGALAPAVRGAAAAPGTGGQLVRLAGRRRVLEQKTVVTLSAQTAALLPTSEAYGPIVPVIHLGGNNLACSGD